MLTLHRDLLRLRRASPALSQGDLALLPAQDGVLAYVRTEGDDRVLVALNLTAEPQDFAPPAGWAHAALRLSTLDGAPPEADGGLRLRPDEGVVLQAFGGEPRA